VDLALSEEQEALREAFADFFTKESGPERVRAAEPLGFDQQLWDQLVATGAPTMGVPEALGGGGATALDLVLVAQELGKHLAPVPFVEAAAAAGVLSATPAGHDLVRDLVDQAAIATVALAPVHGGVATRVPAGAVAEIVLVHEDGALVALRRPAGARPHTAALPNFGASPLADVATSGAGVERIVLATGDEATSLYAGALDAWKLLTAAALDGLRSAALEIGVEYVKARTAFGTPIGAFQAVQHRLSDVTVAGDGARLLVYEAAWARDEGRERASDLTAMAFLFGADVAFRTARESLQFHGGYGYTLEYDIQLYFRRAKAWPLALGDPRVELQRLASRLYPEEQS
jgi:alkylation response protein AidB-like acyl-CoA dehydrogenase